MIKITSELIFLNFLEDKKYDLCFGKTHFTKPKLKLGFFCVVENRKATSKQKPKILS